MENQEWWICAMTWGQNPVANGTIQLGGDLATIVGKKLLSGMILRVWATNGPTKGLGFWM